MTRRSIAFALLALCAASHSAWAQQPPAAIVFFVEWSGALDDVAQDIIKQAALIAQKDAGRDITVTGYADHKGSTKADVYLSELRAQVVADALTADGVARGRIRIVANGALPVSGVIGRRVEITIGGVS